MDARTRSAVRIAKRYLLELKKHRFHVTKAYLYGSYVTGKIHAGSDIDIVVVSPQFTGYRLMDSYTIAKFCRAIDLRISPLAYRPEDFVEDNLIPYEAITKGIRLL
ncbi:MAG: nucleotidyltransferase domain-containing protein [Bacteroidota bacterium]|nr:nucleotidyltransferase domain-containing protein [Bacteroidota bacterium]